MAISTRPQCGNFTGRAAGRGSGVIGQDRVGGTRMRCLTSQEHGQALCECRSAPRRMGIRSFLSAFNFISSQ
ncbi:hypothetical protein GWI33_000720 [Rhynchophorus ferrugineus]|uniref:Uncharacterized protein n=1 Tax=Rhynchophorus ferrugineus TaxID=354439 RepID=A0A834IR02_RHYFE|nr:hypothetical protein GWI33_000720 [Rhynchophorus ferrugineus]